ncbi:MAG: hypothetical protein V4525_02940 [Pseudomonadota bacterium]
MVEFVHSKYFSISSLSIVGISLLLTGCGGGGVSSTAFVPATTDSAFPAQVMLVSPTASGSVTSAPASVAVRMVTQALHIQSVNANEPTDGWSRATVEDRLSAILADPAKLSLSFSPSRFLQASAGYAPCYGPTLNYINHPDGSGANSGQLPAGDLGLWNETVSSSDTTACIAAQLNRNIYAASQQVNMGVMVLAGLRAVSLASTGTPVSTGQVRDLTTKMNDLAISSSISFNSAALARDSTGDIWTYLVDMTYTDSSNKVSQIQFTLAHTRGAGANFPYNGLMTYKISDSVNAGNCPITAGTTERNVVHVGTLKYNRINAESMEVNHRSGQYCGGLANLPTNLVDGDGQLNPSATYDSVSGKGWGDDFSRFAQVYNPQTGEGKYVYAWQAGFGDGNSRIFGVNINTNQTGEGYFGFSDAIMTTTGEIKGMICNWAGPGNSHVPVLYVQRQALAWNSTLSKWEVATTGGSDIRYAPTNSCQYVPTTGNTFWYDRDLTGNTFGDPAQSNLMVDPANSTYPFDLKNTTVSPTTYNTIAEMMNARGYKLPSNF